MNRNSLQRAAAKSHGPIEVSARRSEFASGLKGLENRCRADRGSLHLIVLPCVLPLKSDRLVSSRLQVGFPRLDRDLQRGIDALAP
jgi:hypothetical protein